MRIWILNHYAMARNAKGGTVHAVVGNYLAEAGHDVTIFAAACPFGENSACELPRGRRFADRADGRVRFRYVRTRPYRGQAGRLLNMLSYRTHVLRSTDDLPRPDVIVGSCVHPLAVDAALRLGRRYGVPFIYQIRDIWPATLVDMGVISRRHPLYWYFRHLELQAFRHASGVTAVVPGIQQYAEAHGVAPERICYLPNGIDPELYPAPADPEPAAEFLLSYFGAHGAGNNLHVVLEAAARLQADPDGKDVRIRLVGDGPAKPALQERARAMGLNNVEFCDPVPKPALVPLARQTDAFLFTVRRLACIEQYGLSSNKLFDYLLAGRPVVCGCESLNNPVDEARAGLSVGSTDPEALAGAILRLRRTPAEERARMGRRGRQYVLEHFNLAHVARQWEAFLKRIVDLDAPAVIRGPFGRTSGEAAA